MAAVTVLAKRFSEIVRRELSDNIEEIVRLNNTKEYSDCCATHNYCDANMLMDEAFKQTLGKECDLQNKRDTMLWTKAWELAKSKDFYVMETALQNSIAKEIRSSQIGTL